jgi:hypothetical protein
MKNSALCLIALTPLVMLSSACDRFTPKEALLDTAANLVIKKYQNASCEEVAQMQPQSKQDAPAKGGSEAALQAKAMEMLQKNPQMREEFINRVAGPIANRMFECNLIP